MFSIILKNNVSQFSGNVKLLLHAIGIPSTLRGYYYLNSAALLILRDETYMLNLHEMIYKKLAVTYDTSHFAVERCIRTAIKKSWSSGAIALLWKPQEAFFAEKYKDKQPSNGEFFSFLIGYLQNM